MLEQCKWTYLLACSEKLMATPLVLWEGDLDLQYRVFHRGFGISLNQDRLESLPLKNEGSSMLRFTKHLLQDPSSLYGMRTENFITEAHTQTQSKLLDCRFPLLIRAVV